MWETPFPQTLACSILGSSDRKLFSWSISPSANQCLLAENRNFAGSPSWIQQEKRAVCRQHLDVSSILLLPWSLKTPCLLLQYPPTCFVQENAELSYRDIAFCSQDFDFVERNGLKHFSAAQNGGGDPLVSFIWQDFGDRNGDISLCDLQS